MRPWEPARHAELAFHGVEIRSTVAASDGRAGDEVMKHVLVQDDDPGAALQRVEDPAVRVRVVADVVERDVGLRRALAGLRDDDLEPLAQCGQEQIRVVRDPRARIRRR
jgi:hypothetical protein